MQHEADYLGLGWSNLVNYFVPDVIALGGGVIKSWPLFKDVLFGYRVSLITLARRRGT